MASIVYRLLHLLSLLKIYTGQLLTAYCPGRRSSVIGTSKLMVIGYNVTSKPQELSDRQIHAYARITEGTLRISSYLLMLCIRCIRLQKTEKYAYILSYYNFRYVMHSIST